MKNKEKGITLIALVITIIIMLILITVSITGAIHGGLFKKAGETVKREDLVALMRDLEVKKVIEENNNLAGSLQEIFGDKYNKYNETFEVTNGKLVYIGANSTVIKIAEDLGIKSYAKYVTGDYIGIGQYGELVNLDLWNFQEEDVGYNLYITDNQPAYIGKIIDGKIEGVVPAKIGKIKEDGSIKYKSVTTMRMTFFGLEQLEDPPEIPKSVTNMLCTFASCSNLTEAPKIPDSVTNMASTFYGCSNLKIPPKIPENVTNMYCTFNSCNNLIEAPKIPENVTNMMGTFNQCAKLTKPPRIPLKVENMMITFQKCSSITETPDIPQGVTNLYATFNKCSNLVKATTIPNSVKNMQMTFNRCTKLKGILTINADPTNYSDCLSEVGSSTNHLTINGTSNLKEEIANTGNRAYITVE